MSLNMNQKRRLLESIEYIDDAMISDTMSRVKTDAVTAGMPSKGKRCKSSVQWVVPSKRRMPRLSLRCVI